MYMPTIDADAHVVESERSWDWMEPSDQKYRPRLVSPYGTDGTQYWVIGGKIRGLARPVLTSKVFAELTRVGGRMMESIPEAREMEDVSVRLRHLDELGIDIEVLYPTIFLAQVTDNVFEEVAICRGWNRWLADIWKQSDGRLRWACVLPLLDMPTALEEIEFSKQNGAVAVLLRPVEGPRLLFDPYFHPLYERMSNLHMAAGVHVSNANPHMQELLSQYHSGGGFWPLRLATIGTFHSLICSDIPRLFPDLHWGFIEASAEWVPYTMKHLVRRFNQRGKELPRYPMKEWNTWVTVQVDDNVPYILDYAGDDNFVVGTDYGHQDPSTELNALQILKDRTGITEEQNRKIVDDNARALYQL
jgi:predicted TIM-barrel fold metal-dependent hydrolase